MVRSLIGPEDLRDPVVKEVLELVYQEKAVNTILDHFRDNDETYEKVASMFNGNLLSDDTDEFAFKRGLEDVIRNIRMSVLNEKIEQETDPAKLTDLFQQQSKLAELKL